MNETNKKEEPEHLYQVGQGIKIPDDLWKRRELITDAIFQNDRLQQTLKVLTKEEREVFEKSKLSVKDFKEWTIEDARAIPKENWLGVKQIGPRAWQIGDGELIAITGDGGVVEYLNEFEKQLQEFKKEIKDGMAEA